MACDESWLKPEWHPPSEVTQYYISYNETLYILQRNIIWISSSEMRSRLGWTTLANRWKLLRAKYTRRCLRGQGPKYMQCMFTTNEKMGLRSTHPLKDIYLPSHKTNWLAKSFIYCAGQDWNNLPLSLTEE